MAGVRPHKIHVSNQLSELLPDLTLAVVAALRTEGYARVADTLGAQVIERCTYDPTADAGYIYLVQNPPIHYGETPAAETVAFAAPHWFNVDLRISGSVFGIELLSPSPAFKVMAECIP